MAWGKRLEMGVDGTRQGHRGCTWCGKGTWAIRVRGDNVRGEWVERVWVYEGSGLRCWAGVVKQTWFVRFGRYG